MKIVDITEENKNYRERKKYGEKISTNVDKIDFENIFNKYRQHIQPAIDAYLRGVKIWRGILSDQKMIIVDPTKVERRGNAPYTNLLQSNLPNWKSYPPRNRSLICTTSKYYAGGYADFGQYPYIVLPFDNPLIGIVPDNDFHDTMKEFGGPYFINNDLNVFYKNLQKLTNHEKSSIQKLPYDKIEFFKALEKMESMIKQIPKNKIKIFNDNLAKALIANGVINGLSEIMDPKKNKFRTVPLSKFNIKNKDYEVWISAPAILIQKPILDKLLSK